MRNRKWLFVCAAALFSFTAYTQLTFADSQESTDSTEQTSKRQIAARFKAAMKPSIRQQWILQKNRKLLKTIK